jgi:hypothetical protein
MPQMTKKGARSVTNTLDRIATLMQNEWKTLGVPQHIAADMAYRCDLLSDTIEKRAGLDRTALSEFDPKQEKGFDPENIGEEKSGPLEQVDKDEPYMRSEFTQQENRELREAIEGNELGPDKTKDDEQSPQAGKQAFEQAGRQMYAQKVNAALTQVLKAPAASKLAHALLDVQSGVLSGRVAAAQAERALKAVALVLPHLASKDAAKVATLIDQAVKVAGEVPPQFLANIQKKKDEAKGDEGKDEDKDDKKPDFLKDKDSGKKASAEHGFNLFA